MTEKRYHTLVKEIEKGVFSPLYLFFGEEKYLIEEAIDKIERSLVSPDAKDFSYKVIYADEESASSMIDEAKTLSFMGGKKVLVIKNIDQLKKGDDSAIIDYCNNPSPESCVIFTASTIDKRKKFFQVLSKKGVVVRFGSLSESDVMGCIKRKLEEGHVTISEEALAYLVNFIGRDLQTINNELEKVISFAGTGKEITLEDLETVTGDVHLRSIFEISSAIGWKKRGEALKLIHKILSQGEFPLKILGLIAYQFRMIMLSKYFLMSGYSIPEISKKLGIPVTFLKEYIEQGKHFQLDELVRYLKELLAIDLKLKSSRLHPKTILESLVLKI